MQRPEAIPDPSSHLDGSLASRLLEILPESLQMPRAVSKAQAIAATLLEGEFATEDFTTEDERAAVAALPSTVVNNFDKTLTQQSL